MNLLNPFNRGRVAALALLLLAAPFAATMGAVALHDGSGRDHRPGEADECWLHPGSASAEITDFGNGQTQFQAAGNTWNIDSGQSAIFSFDGGFWVGVNHKCLEHYILEVFVDGEKTQEEHRSPACLDGHDDIWVNLGLQAGQVTLVLSWWGCDGTRGFGDGSSYAGDPPIFTSDGEVRTLV